MVGESTGRADGRLDQAEPADHGVVPEAEQVRLERRRHQDQPAHTISTMRRIAPCARSATSGGTVTWCCMSRSESRTFSSVIIFM